MVHVILNLSSFINQFYLFCKFQSFLPVFKILSLFDIIILLRRFCTFVQISLPEGHDLIRPFLRQRINFFDGLIEALRVFLSFPELKVLSPSLNFLRPSYYNGLLNLFLWSAASQACNLWEPGLILVSSYSHLWSNNRFCLDLSWFLLLNWKPIFLHS
jgi:hypothetical protein